MLLSSYLENWWRHKVKDFPDRENKREITEIQKLEHLENEKSFPDEIKIIFHNKFKSYHLTKKMRTCGQSFKGATKLQP